MLGLFTWALLEGLRGGADLNSDRFVTAGELFGYVRNRVRVETAFRQNPRVLPGLNDSHVHFPTWSLGQRYGRALAVPATRRTGRPVKNRRRPNLRRLPKWQRPDRPGAAARVTERPAPAAPRPRTGRRSRR